MPPRNMSVSSARDWTECPRRWWYKNEAHATIPDRESSHLNTGTALHAGLAAAYEAATHDTNPYRGHRMDDFQNHALEALHAELQPRNHNESALAEGELISVLRELPRPAPAAILGVELGFRELITDFYLQGSIDLILRTGHDSIHIRDWKHSTLPNGDSVQAAVYITVAKILFPWAKTITFGYYSIKKLCEIPIDLDDSVRQHRIDTIRWTATQIDEQIGWTKTFPAKPATDVCASCRFRSYCPESIGPKPELVAGFSAEDVLSTRNYLIKKLGEL
jgi:hypothetical protein